ncbi:MAG: ABC-2 family transporter protein [Anaerolineaceae bacterium]|nr:ABC-2 family transporter protein [Anaerolineaceae bacterium]
MHRLKVELSFLKALIGVNLSSAMEYRASFISQIVGMLINNGIYFVFWLIFFDQFGAVRGYAMADIYLLFAVATLGYGLAYMFAGNVGHSLAYLIAQGRLDYYLVLPRPLLPHVIFSRMVVSTIGDVTFGLLAYLFTGRFHPVEILLFLVCAVLAGAVFVGFSVISGSLAFFMGSAQYVSQQMTNALLTFALYPHTLFSGGVRVLLFTLLPAAFIAAVPVEIISTRNGRLLLWLVVAAVVTWVVATAVFYLGLRRYESGSALNVNV